ncbi:MAG: MBL fold metallo-hydrolase [Flavobacteriales bacterium]|nr:MBL fold metallo-hydrolase [Flavobacteriales bacterium]|tara:strand:- start:12868 stop:13638 length:771 start_codon:yes stop_codon:yes gene_type:complete
MHKLNAIFLGTGTSQGVPIIGCSCIVCKSLDIRDKRLRSSLLLSINDLNILIDIGPDFRQQALKLNVSKIDHILFTHFHRDHTSGLDDLRPIYYMNRSPINLYCESSVRSSLENDYNYIFSDTHYPGKPEFNLNVIKNHPFKIENLSIQPIRVNHGILPILGYRVGKLAYITDASFISSEEKKKLLNLDILIVNSLQRKKHVSHFNLKDSLLLINELKPKKSYLTHISHNMGLHRKVKEELPENIFLAYDGLSISV